MQGVTDSFAGKLAALDCLGFLRGSCCPHYDGEVERRPTYHRLLRNGDIAPGFAIDDGAAIHFLNDQVHGVVASRQSAKAYRIEVTNGTVTETPMPVDYRGASALCREATTPCSLGPPVH